MARWQRNRPALTTPLKRFHRSLFLQRLEDRVTPAIGLMGPYSRADMSILNETAGAAWSALPSRPTPTDNQVTYLDAPNAWYFSLDDGKINDKLADAPWENTSNYRNGGFNVSIPRPDGTLQRFQVWEMSIMEQPLADKFPDIHTYRGQGIDDPTAQLAMDVTTLGFHAQVLSPNGRYYIDPYFHLEQSAYISYFSSDLIQHDSWECSTGSINLDNGEAASLDLSTAHSAGCSCALCQVAMKSATTTADPTDGSGGGATANKLSNGTDLRQYRLALAANFEYSAFFGGTNAAVQSALTSAVNRVTGVYESEVAVRLILVGNNDLLIYSAENGFTASTDPYTNGNGSSMLGENQSKIDSVIGTANYDIGHVFSTGGGGIAGLGVVTISGSKARGVTGQSSPNGDGFWIDYVAHEMGHQFDGNHTFNSSQLSGNRNGSTAYEPGSGSTIMAYAGLGDDYVLHSDPYFHSESLDEITDFIATHPGSATISTGNNIPSVNAGADYVIPTSTPFALTVLSSSDPDSDPLTFDWQERDLGVADLLNSADNAASPRFRPFSPTTSPTRTFPQLSNILANTDLSTAKTGERLFTSARTANFRVIARDNKAGGGAYATDDMKLTVVNTGSAFAVTSPNTAVSLASGSTQTITWNVAGTTANGINTASVNILLSTDGGLTFPTVLAAATANDGSQAVTLPVLATNNARIKIEAVGNVFFDISDANFTIGNFVSITSVTPASGSTVTAPMTQIDVQFSDNILAGTVGTGDLLLSVGSVTNAQLITPNTIRYTLIGLTSEGNLTATLPQNAVTNGSGVGNSTFVGNYTIDYGTTAFPVPLTASGAAGSFAYTGTATGIIGGAGDSDSFTINLDAGQTVSVLLTPSSTLRASITVTGPGGVNQSNSAASAGAFAVLQTVTAAMAGTYTLVVSSLASTTGTYTARLDLNGAIETENSGGAANNTTATAQPLSGFIDLGGADRALIRGRAETAGSDAESNDTLATASNLATTFVSGGSGFYQLVMSGATGTSGDVNDYYSLGALQIGDVITVTLSGADGGRGLMVDPFAYLYRANTASIVTSNDDRFTTDFDSLIYRHTVSIDDTYYLLATVASGSGNTYQATVYLENSGTAPTTGSGFYLESAAANGQKTTAEAGSANSWIATNYVSTISGNMDGTSDVDYYKFTFNSGDVVSTFATSSGSSDLAVSFYDAAGTLLYNEKGSSTSLGTNSAMYAYRIASTGDYFVRVANTNSTTGGYTLRTELATTLAPPAPQSAFDIYSFAATAGQPLSLSLKGITAGTLNFDLLNAAGTVMGSGTAGATNFDKTLNFTPSATETWFVRVSGASNTEYQMMVTRGAAQDTEANDSFATAQPLINNKALGSITANDDWYTIPVTAGQVLTFSTTTPGDGVGQFVNVLDPAIELYSPSNVLVGSDDNSAVDGRNAVLTKAAAVTGDYRVRVRGISSTGEYVLGLSISNDPAPQVSSSVIDDNSIQRSRITSLTVNFSEPVTLPSNKGDAFLLTRSYPTSDTVSVTVDETIFSSSGGTQAVLTFSGPPAMLQSGSLVDGNYTLTVLASQVLDSVSQPMASNYSVNFHRLYGDSNGDKTVNQTDYNAFRLAFLAGPSHEFDVDSDGDVLQSDFNAFRLNFLATLP